MPSPRSVCLATYMLLECSAAFKRKRWVEVFGRRTAPPTRPPHHSTSCQSAQPPNSLHATVLLAKHASSSRVASAPPPPHPPIPPPPQDFEMRYTEHANDTMMIPLSDALNFAFSLRASYVRSSVKHALKCTLSRHPTFVSCGGILARTSMQARTKPRKQTQSL